MREFDDMVQAIRNDGTLPDTVRARVDATLANLPEIAAENENAGSAQTTEPRRSATERRRLPKSRGTRHSIYRKAMATAAVLAIVASCLFAALTPGSRGGMTAAKHGAANSGTPETTTDHDTAADRKPALGAEFYLVAMAAEADEATGGTDDAANASDVTARGMGETAGGTNDPANATAANPTATTAADVIALTDEGVGMDGYTGLLFGVTGERIRTVAATIDRGEFYRMERTALTKEEEQALIADGIDRTDVYAHQIWGDEEQMFDDYCVNLGAQFVDDYADGVYYGFYVPHDLVEANDEYDLAAWSHKNIDTFDGATMTITVTYADGSAQTQAYMLASGRLKCAGEHNDILYEFIADDDHDTPYIYGLLATRVR